MRVIVCEDPATKILFSLWLTASRLAPGGMLTEVTQRVPATGSVSEDKPGKFTPLPLTTPAHAETAGWVAGAGRTSPGCPGRVPTRC